MTFLLLLSPLISPWCPFLLRLCWALSANHLALLPERAWGRLHLMCCLLEAHREGNGVEICPHCSLLLEGSVLPHMAAYFSPLSSAQRPPGYGSPNLTQSSPTFPGCQSMAHDHSSGFIQFITFQNYFVYLFSYFLILSPPSQYKLYNSRDVIWLFFHWYMSKH